MSIRFDRPAVGGVSPAPIVPRLLLARLLLALLLLLPGPVWATPGLQLWAGQKMIACNTDGTLLLDGGQRIRLVGLTLPRREPVQHPWRASVPLLPALQAELDRLPGTVWDLYLLSDQPDRSGRLSALPCPPGAAATDPACLSVRLLQDGLAQVRSRPDEDSLLPLLLAAETSARQARRGVWADPQRGIHPASDGQRLQDSYQIVDGIVQDVRFLRDGVLIRFGTDVRRTVAVRMTLAQATKLGQDPSAWTGHRLRVRGWVGKSLGPLITLTHPGQLECCDLP